MCVCVCARVCVRVCMCVCVLNQTQWKISGIKIILYLYTILQYNVSCSANMLLDYFAVDCFDCLAHTAHSVASPAKTQHGQDRCPIIFA